MYSSRFPSINVFALLAILPSDSSWGLTIEYQMPEGIRWQQSDGRFHKLE
jgi:hypothetical protein